MMRKVMENVQLPYEVIYKLAAGNAWVGFYH